jgi:hypothetical protein
MSESTDWDRNHRGSFYIRSSQLYFHNLDQIEDPAAKPIADANYRFGGFGEPEPRAFIRCAVLMGYSALIISCRRNDIDASPSSLWKQLDKI